MNVSTDKLSNGLRLTFYFAAITGLFLAYSLIQERLMTVGFGPEEEIFEHSIFIVLINRLVTCVVSAAALAHIGSTLKPTAPLALFAVPSLANVIGSTAQYEALKYVSFPLQALAKCAKAVPVMAWTLVTRTRTYTQNDYLSAGMLTLGCTLFVLTGDIIAPTVEHRSLEENAWSFTTVGLCLLAVFMVFDGLTCTSQDKLFASYEMHSCNQLLYTAAWSAAFSALFLLGSGQLLAAVAFVHRHPTSLWLMLMQSAVSTAVQLFIVFTIKQYGALNFAIMMTLRQYLSIVLSCLVFQHKLSSMQWIGTLLVIAGLAARSMGLSKAPSTPSRRSAADAEDSSEPLLQRAPSAGQPKWQIPVIQSVTRLSPPQAGTMPFQQALNGAKAAAANIFVPSPYQPSPRGPLVSPAFGSGDYKVKPG